MGSEKRQMKIIPDEFRPVLCALQVQDVSLPVFL
jgi:hypothetical protein